MSDILAGGPPGAPPSSHQARIPDPFPGQSAAEQPDRDRRRSAISIAVAAVLHAAAILLVALLVTSGQLDQALPPFSVNLLLASSPTPAVQGGPAGAEGVTGSGVAPASGGASSTAAGDGFVIPSPRSTPSGSTTTASTGSGFRVAGGTAGGGASLPAVQSQAPGATLPASQSGTSSGTGGSSVQRSGQGVTVGDALAGTKQGLDLSSLDKSIAGSSGGTSGGGSRGTSTGGGTTTAGGASSGSAIEGPNYRVSWDHPDASKGRQLVSAVPPVIPASVGQQGLTLSVTVSFTLDANGVLSGVAVIQSSGYAQVDSAVMKAIAKWRFTPARGAADVTGIIPFKIVP